MAHWQALDDTRSSVPATNQLANILRLVRLSRRCACGVVGRGLQQLVAEVGQRPGRNQFVSDEGYLAVGGVEMHRGLTDESVGVAHVESGHGMGLAVAPFDVQDDGPSFLLSHLVLPVVGLSIQGG
jgi:hypothetical protein